MAPRKLKHPVPAGLGKQGKALWRAIVADLPDGWQLDERELHLLTEAAGTADDIAALQAVVKKEGHVAKGAQGQRVVHPAVAEVRQLRNLQRTLLAGLELTDPDEAKRSATPAQARARKAAAARWSKQPPRIGRKEVNGGQA